MNKHQIVSEQNLNDIENAIIEKVMHLKNTNEVTSVQLKFRGSGNKTFATLIWSQGKDIHSKTGIATKRKGDKYNRRTGELIALIDMV